MKKTVSLLLCFMILIAGIMITPAMAAEEENTPAITEATLKQGSSSKVYTVDLLTHADSQVITTGFVEPVVKEEGITDSSADGYYLYSNFSSYFNMFTGADSQYYYYNIPDEMKDATYFRMKRTWGGSRNDTGSPTQNPTSREAVVLTLNHSAVVYYVYQGTSDSGVATNATWLNEDEWTKSEETAQYVNASGVVSDYIIYEKQFDVPEGETATVEIGGQKGAYLAPQIFVDWIVEEKITPETSNETLKQGSSSKVYTVKIADRTDAEIVKDGFTAPVRKEGAVSDTEAENYYDVSNLDSYFKVLTDKDYYFHSIPEEIYDAQYFRLKSGWQGTKGDTGSPTQNPDTTEALTFDINSTATVYYVYQSNTTENITLTASWLKNDGWTVCDDLVEYIGGSGIHYDYHLFKKKFIVNPGETVNVKIGGFYNSNLPPMVFVDWLNEETTKNINVSVTGNGKVNKPGNQDVAIGETFSVMVTPDEGYVIDYIKFNGNDVVANANGIYTTPEITEDSVIEVAFREINELPQVTSCMQVFAATDEETGHPSAITFATVGAGADYEASEFGIVFSKTDETPTLEEDGIKYQAVSKNEFGQYGVKLYGTGLKADTTYYTAPYTIYQSIHGKTVVYGAAVSFTPCR